MNRLYMTLCLLVFANLTVFGSEDSEDLLIQHLYDNRAYYAENIDESTEGALIRSLTDTLIIYQRDEELFKPYLDSSLESFSKNRTALLNGIASITSQYMYEPRHYETALWDTVFVKGLILALALDSSKYSFTNLNPYYYLTTMTAVPVLTYYRELIISTVQKSQLSQNERNTLLSYLPLPDSLKTGILADTTLPYSVRCRVLKDRNSLDSLIRRYEEIPNIQPSGQFRVEKEPALRRIISLGTPEAQRYAVKVFNDSVYSFHIYSIATIRAVIISEFAKYYRDPLFHEIWKKMYGSAHFHRINHAKYIELYVSWFKQNLNAEPRIPTERSIPYFFSVEPF